MGDEKKADKDNIMDIRREDKPEDTSLFFSYELGSVITKSFDLKSMTAQKEKLRIFDIKKGTFRKKQHSFNAIYTNSLTMFEPRCVPDSHINTIASSIQAFEEQISHLCRMSTEAVAHLFKTLKFKQGSFRVSEPDHLSLQLLQRQLNDGLSRTRYQGQLLETPEKHHEDSEGAPENYSSSRDNFDKGKHFSSNNNQATKLSEVKRKRTDDQPVVPCPECQDQRIGKEPHPFHWIVASFRPRDSVRPRPRYSSQVHTEPFPLDNLRQRMQQRPFRIASMVHLGSSLPLGVVRLADADLYYDEDKDEMCCCNCSWRMPRTQFQETKDPVECHSCRGRTRGDCGEGAMGIAGPAESVAHEDSLPLAESKDNAVPPCVEVDGCVGRNTSASLLLADDTVTDCFSSSESIAQFPRERCTAGCSGSFHQLGSETSSATMDALLSTGETACLVQQSSSNSGSCTNDQSSAEGIGFETDNTSSSEDMGSGQSPCLHTAELRTESLTDAADQSFSEDEATRHDSETESTYHENHSPTESCGDEMHEDETDLKS